MISRLITIGTLSLAVVMVVSCSTLDNQDQRKAVCNQLKSKLIFNGNTSNNRISNIQNAEDPMLQRQYDKYHCDEI